MNRHTTRREFLIGAATASLAFGAFPRIASAEESRFSLDYIVGSCMYGELLLDEVLAEVPKTGASYIDIWPKKHANHREQVEAMGLDAFQDLLDKHHVRLGMLTHYDLGPFKLQEEMKVLSRFGGKIVISGSRRAKGEDLKADVKQFLEEMKPHVAAAEEQGVIIGIENHGNALIESPDSLRYFADGIDSDHIGIAFAPYHLPQDPEIIAKLIEDIGPRLVHFYAWEHGLGSHKKMPKVLEMKQLPGYGELDFVPILAALKKINYAGWTSIFMHPVPRGIPILPTAAEVTAAISRSREYLEDCLDRIR
ncbi:MAG: sugar phosphate isomerase/epimerase [Candidatus Omnitrophica bacterium]|nr:sugar phosphate isomerase/epimerase [Candidatus Omnitrophota bacterium]